MLKYIRTTVNPLLQQPLWYRPNAAETWGNGPNHFYRGALVTCHGLGVVKWMNGIRAQPLLGGCLCDVLPGWTRLPSQPDLNSKSSHHRTHEHARKRANTHIYAGCLWSVNFKQYTVKGHKSGVDKDTFNTYSIAGAVTKDIFITYLSKFP